MTHIKPVHGPLLFKGYNCKLTQPCSTQGLHGERLKRDSTYWRLCSQFATLTAYRMGHRQVYIMHPVLCLYALYSLNIQMATWICPCRVAERGTFSSLYTAEVCQTFNNTSAGMKSTRHAETCSTLNHWLNLSIKITGEGQSSILLSHSAWKLRSLLALGNERTGSWKVLDQQLRILHHRTGKILMLATHVEEQESSWHQAGGGVLLMSTHWLFHTSPKNTQSLILLSHFALCKAWHDMCHIFSARPTSFWEA